MKLTQHTNYAIRMLMYCNSKNGLATIGDISEFYGISQKFLTKILLTLTKQGFTETIRGRNGGIKLARPADQIFLGDVVRKVEENFELAECFRSDQTTCPLIHSCNLNKALSRALQGFFDILNEYTLNDLTGNSSNINVLVQLTSGIDKKLAV